MNRQPQGLDTPFAGYDGALAQASLKRDDLRYGIASACIGGGQVIALLIENPDATGMR